MEEFFDQHKKKICYLIIAIVVVVGLLLLLIWSIDTVEPIEYGLKYNQLTRKPDYTKVYTGGWYLVGPFHYFLTFPSVWVNVDFAEMEGAKSGPVTTTVEQSSVILSFSFQYSLIKDQIPALYKDQNMNYENKIITLAKGINEISSSLDITIDGFWTDRENVEKQILEFLDEKLQASGFSTCVGFQIIKIQLKDTKEQSYINTQLSKQVGIQKTYEQIASNIRTQISVDTSNAQKTITIIYAEAEAAATTLKNVYDSAAQNITISSQSSAYAEVSSLTGLTIDDNLLEYIYLTNLLNSQNITLVVGLNSGTAKITQLNSEGFSGKGYTF